MLRLPLLLSALAWRDLSAVKMMQNGIAAPEVVHTPMRLTPRCTVHAPPLDLIFVLDSSGSLRNKFQDEIDIIRRIVNHVTIGAEATRVMLVQFSGIQHLEFNLLKFTSRDEVLAALDALRHVSGVTRIGGAFKFTREALSSHNGLRDSSVPKIVYLLSDGRTHDYPLDYQEADTLRRSLPNLDIWAYGTGDFVAMPALLNYTKTVEKIITNENLSGLEAQFEAWKGTEVCEKVPVCIKGSDKPVDIVLVFDASESVDRLFEDQIHFAVERIVQNINVNHEAARIALITYSGKVFTHFVFDDPRISNNTAVIRHLNTLRSIKGTTSTHEALSKALEVFNKATERKGANKLVIVLTDGHSKKPPASEAARLREIGATILAVSVTPRPLVDERELESIAGTKDRVFIPSNLQDFEVELMKHVGVGCVGIPEASDLKPEIRGATDVSCDANSLTFTVRTRSAMKGLVYAQHFADNDECKVSADGSTRQVTIRFAAGKCGLEKHALPSGKGYSYNTTIVVQFHPIVMTRADQGLEVSCVYATPTNTETTGVVKNRDVSKAQCDYTLHRYGPTYCVALDASVGETLHHKWQCNIPSNYHFLVHDCHVKSEKHSAMIIDSQGCQLDEHVLETPNYGRATGKLSTLTDFVTQEMSVFKFPGDNYLLFQCHVSLCDMHGQDECTKMIPPKCSNNTLGMTDSRDGLRRARREVVQQKRGFDATFQVETRTLNVVEDQSMRTRETVKYCSLR